MPDISQKLKDFIKAHLPLAQFMEVDVESYDGQTLVLTAPLDPNINDKKTAFGGSLYNASVLAGWGSVYLITEKAGIKCNQVVTKASIEYRAPVHGVIRATCNAPDEKIIEEFIAKFKEKGRAKMTVQATIECSGKTAVEFEATYAILSD